MNDHETRIYMYSDPAHRGSSRTAGDDPIETAVLHPDGPDDCT